MCFGVECMFQETIKNHFVNVSLIVKQHKSSMHPTAIHFILKTIQMKKSFTKNNSRNIKKDAKN